MSLPWWASTAKLDVLLIWNWYASALGTLFQVNEGVVFAVVGRVDRGEQHRRGDLL